MPENAVPTIRRMLTASGYMVVPLSGPFDLLALRCSGASPDIPEALVIAVCGPGDLQPCLNRVRMVSSALSAGAGQLIEVWCLEEAGDRGASVARYTRYGRLIARVRAEVASIVQVGKSM